MNFWKSSVGILAVMLWGSVAPALAAIVQSAESQGMAYFLADSPARVERYHLEAGQWLGAVNLPTTRGKPTAMAVDANGLYVAYDKMVFRYAFDGTGETHLMNTQYPVVAIHTDGNVIYVNYSSGYDARLASINKTTNVLIATVQTRDAVYGSSIAPGARKIFGRSWGLSPSDITYVSYTAAGSFEEGGQSPYHGDYADATKTYIFPNQSRVVDNSGTVYSTGDLTYAGSLAGAFDDIAFSGGDVPVVARGKELTAYTSSLLLTGSKTLAQEPYKIFVNGANVVAFTLDGAASQGLSVAVVPLTDLKAATPGEPVNPVGLPYTPDATFLGQDGQLYLFSKANQSVFRWDPVTQQYGATIPLQRIPSYVAYNNVSDRIYIAYPNGEINKIDLTDPTLTEKPFYNLPAAPMGLSCAGSYLFAANVSGSWGTHFTVDRFGLLVSAVDWSLYSTEYIWSDVRQKMYFFRDNLSPNDLNSEEINANGTAYASLPPGGIGLIKDTPLHDSNGFTHPIRVSPDGAKVVLGSGRVFDAVTLEPSPLGLGNAVVDISWMGYHDLRTVRSSSNGSQYQQWIGTTYAPGLVKEYPGTPKTLLNINSSRQLGVAMSDDRPSFYLLDQNFELIAPASLAKPSAPYLGSPLTFGAGIDVRWADIAGETSYVVERRTLPDGSWNTLGTTSISLTRWSDSPVTRGYKYAYRVTAKNGDLASAPSDELVVSLLPPGQPQGFAAVSPSPLVVSLTWTDVPDNTNYQIERATSPSGPFTSWARPDADATSYLVSSASGTTYYFRIKAQNAFGYSPSSEVVMVQTARTAPDAPVFSTITQDYGVITLSWSDVSSEDAYMLERRVTGDSTWMVLVTLRPDTVTYADKSVVAGTSYDYRIKATNVLGSSAYATKTGLRAPNPPDVPAAPPFILTSANSSSSIAVYWGAVLGIQSYQVERSQNGTNWSLLATTPSVQTYYTDKGLVANQYYQYRIRAVSAVGGVSLPSNTALCATLSKLAEWRLANFGTVASTGSAASLATGADGVPNLLKFASNQSPTESGQLSGDAGTKGTAVTSVDPQSNKLRVTYVRFRAASNPGISYEVQFSSSFGDWAAGGTEVQVTPIDATWERVIWEDSVTIDTVPRRFGRVKVTELTQ